MFVWKYKGMRIPAPAVSPKKQYQKMVDENRRNSLFQFACDRDRYNLAETSSSAIQVSYIFIRVFS